ncbi:MAG: tyrosine-type recombinase/integrase [Merismopedia sp. SIO2A8]|nr:tyrosine-type recombinase/integrase [Symploca sp. SIO2B6]NET47315.1 tyrosine-type recombinase/integrase [Merismopedia sp. SIO2A8]
MLPSTAPGSFSAKFFPSPPVKPAYSGEREYLRPDEVEALIQAAKSVGRHRVRDAAMILLMFRHGLRTAELVRLKWSSVDFQEGYLEVQRVKHGHCSIHPLRSPELRALRQLQRDYPDTQYVFVSERKAPLSTRLVRHVVARAGRLVQFRRRVHPHQLRHACGYYLATSGQDTRAIQDYLGHRNIQHTVRYTQLNPSRFESFWSD